MTPIRFYKLLLWFLFIHAAVWIQLASAQGPTYQYQQALGWLEEGRRLLTQRNYAQAQAQFTRYVQVYPNDPRGYFWLGMALDEAGDADAALQQYSRALDAAKELSMDASELRSNLGNTLLKLHYIKEATYDFKRALEIDPTQMQAHVGLAQAYLSLNQYQDALAELQVCSDHRFFDPSLPFLKARALLGLGRTGEAREQLQLYEHGVAGATGDLVDSARLLLQQLPPQTGSSG